MELLIDLLHILFFLITGYACLFYTMDNWRLTTLYSTGRKYWQHRIMEIACAIIGVWHLLYAWVLAAYLIAWSLPA